MAAIQEHIDTLVLECMEGSKAQNNLSTYFHFRRLIPSGQVQLKFLCQMKCSCFQFLVKEHQ